MKQFLVLLIVGVSSVAALKYPDEIPLCKSDDGDCVKNSINVVVRTFENGIPNINVPPFDPFHVSLIDIVLGEESPLNIRLRFIDCDLVGVTKLNMEDFKIIPSDDSKTKWVGKGTIPAISILGKYDIKGRVLLLPIVGNGDINCTIANVKLDIHIVTNMKAISKKGKQYMQIETFEFKFDTSRLYMYMENLFNGNKELGDSMNSFLNENWPDILKEIKPSLEDTFGVIFKEVINGFFRKISVEESFLPQ